MTNRRRPNPFDILAVVLFAALAVYLLSVWRTPPHKATPIPCSTTGARA